MTKQLSSARLVRGAGSAPAVISQGVPVAPASTGPARAVLYDDKGLHGRSLALAGAVPDLERSSFNDAAVSLYVESGTWVACRDAYFRGGCRSFEPGRYDELAVFGFDRTISSIRPGGGAERAREVPRGVGMELFAEPDFRGEKLGFESDGMDLGQNNFSRRAQSLIVYVGNWEVCTDVGIRGSCAVYRPGNYPRLGGMNRQIASLRRIQ
ncbi:MAG: beta/gamma crystallin-related protein [Caldimonas sp.]